MPERGAGSLPALRLMDPHLLPKLRRALPNRLRRASARARYYRASPAARKLATAVSQEKLSYLERGALIDLWDRVRDIERQGIPGELIEAGTARGGSALVIAAAKAAERPLRLFDVFGMIPSPSPRDGADVRERYRVIAAGEATGPGGTTYYGYEDDLLSQVRGSFSRYAIPPDEHNVELVAGLYEETLHPHGPVAFAHLDCDWYESVRVCLERLTPLLQPGGALVIDDYDNWSGCRDAVDEYFADKRDRFRFERRSRLHVVARGEPAVRRDPGTAQP